MFDFKHFKGDLLGGITAGIVALPLALAFGVSSGLGPSAGLYGAIFLSFFAALFGGTSTQISGPTAPMTAVSMLIIAGIIASNEGDLSLALPAILMVFILAGLIQILLGFLGLGEYIKFIPYPVVSGFMSAIGIIIIITQIIPAMGYYPKEDTQYVDQFKPYAEEVLLENLLLEESGEGILVLEDFKETIKRAHEITPEAIDKESKTLAAKDSSGVLGSLKILPTAIKNINWLEFALALGTIIIIFGFKYITDKVPSTLVALLVMTGIAMVFKLDYVRIAKIPNGLPIPHLSIFSNFSLASIAPYIVTAITLALLGAIDSLLTSVVADNMTKTKHNPNKELIGQGIGNSIAAIFGGIPGAGATIRTVVNIKAGGKTRLSGMVAGVLLLIILIALSPIASKIPAAVLAGILITVGIGVMDYKGLKAIPFIPRHEVVIMLVVLVLSSVWNLVYAVGIGLALASLLFMKKIGDLTASNSEVVGLPDHILNKKDENKNSLWKDKVVIKHIKGPLFFGSTNDLLALAERIPSSSKVVVICMDKMPYIDQSGLYALEEMIMNLRAQNNTVILVNIPKQPRYLLERIDIIPDLVSTDNIFDNIEESLQWIEENDIINTNTVTI